MGEGAIDVTRRVAEVIPEFGANGKDAITIEQVMLHTSGFPRAPFAPLEWDDRDRRLARFANWRCNWEPGTRFEYHPTSAHWVLAELIERVTGSDFRDFVRTRVIEPLRLARAPARRAGRSARRHQRARAHGRAGDARRARSRARHPRASVVGCHDRRVARLQSRPRCAQSACPAAAASRPRPISRSSIKRCCTTRSGCGMPTCSPTSRRRCATRFPTTWARRPTAPAGSW